MTQRVAASGLVTERALRAINCHFGLTKSPARGGEGGDMAFV